MATTNAATASHEKNDDQARQILLELQVQLLNEVAHLLQEKKARTQLSMDSLTCSGAVSKCSHFDGAVQAQPIFPSHDGLVYHRDPSCEQPLLNYPSLPAHSVTKKGNIMKLTRAGLFPIPANPDPSEAEYFPTPSPVTLNSVGNKAVSDGRHLLDAKAKKSKKKRMKEIRKVGTAKSLSPSDAHHLTSFPFPGTQPSSISRSDTADSVHAKMHSTQDLELRKGLNPIERQESFDPPYLSNSECVKDFPKEMVLNDVLGGGQVVDPHLVPTVDQGEDVVQDRITGEKQSDLVNVTLKYCGKDSNGCGGDVICAEMALELVADEAAAVADNQMEGDDVDKIDIYFGEADQKLAIGDEELSETFTQNLDSKFRGKQRLDDEVLDGEVELFIEEAKTDKATNSIDVGAKEYVGFGVGREDLGTDEAESVGKIEVETVGEADQVIVREDVIPSSRNDEEDEEVVRTVAVVDEVQRMEPKIEDEVVRAVVVKKTSPASRLSEKDEEKLGGRFFWMLITGAAAGAVAVGTLIYVFRKWPFEA